MSKKTYTRNTDSSFWKTPRLWCNCGSFALDTQTWVTPYDNDEYYTEEYRLSLMREMVDEGIDRQTILRVILDMDQEALLYACSWIEPVLPNEIVPEDRVVAYRLCLDEDLLERGIIDDDYHFRVRIDGVWFEKCGEEEIRFCGTEIDEEPWLTAPHLLYDSDIIYFRFKK